MIWAVCLVILLFASDASCQTLVTYSSKSSEELLCPITEQTLTATWADETSGNTLAAFETGQPDIVIAQPGPKHNNFRYNISATSFSLFIQDVQAEDGGDYVCNTVGGGATRYDHTVVVEVLAKPTVKNGSQDVDVLDVIVGTSYGLTCSAAGARSVSDLSLMWDPSLVENTGLIVTPNVNFTDYSITSTYIAKKGDSTITCQLTGYVMQDEINDQLITHTVNLTVRYAPMCSLVIQGGEDCREVTLTCDKCDAVPADITLYSFFNGSSLIHNGISNTFTTSVAYGTLSSFSCSATNSIGPGDETLAKDHNCDEGTTALPTTTIVTTAPMSTNEPTSTKATESTTEKSGSTTTKKPDPDFPKWVIILIIVVVLAVVIAVIAVIMYKKGKCGSNSSSSSVTDVKVTATNSHTTNSEPAPAPVYGEIKKDRKKKSDKLDDNGAGPRGDPEIPAYGVVDKNRTKDPTPAPRSSMRDSKNPSNPKQDGPLELQYAALDHGNKPPSDEVRKPKEEPTEYATVQSVIV